MAQLAEAGCVAFSQANVPDRRHPGALAPRFNTRDLRFPVWLRAEDLWLAKGRRRARRRGATRLGLPAIPAFAEDDPRSAR